MNIRFGFGLVSVHHQRDAGPNSRFGFSEARSFLLASHVKCCKNTRTKIRQIAQQLSAGFLVRATSAAIYYRFSRMFKLTYMPKRETSTNESDERRIRTRTDNLRSKLSATPAPRRHKPRIACGVIFMLDISRTFHQQVYHVYD